MVSFPSHVLLTAVRRLRRRRRRQCSLVLVVVLLCVVSVWNLWVGGTAGPASDARVYEWWQAERTVSQLPDPQQLQAQLGAPLNDNYRSVNATTIRLQKPPPNVCSAYYGPVINIDTVLTKMLGPNPSKIATSSVQQSSTTPPISTLQLIFKDNVLYYVGSPPKDCVHPSKLMSVVAFLAVAYHNLHLVASEDSLSDVAFRYQCTDNPGPPFSGLWSYSGLKDANTPTLVFPDDTFVTTKWLQSAPISSKRLSQKPKMAAWYGGKSGYVPMPYGSVPGYVQEDLGVPNSFWNHQTSREHFVHQIVTKSRHYIRASYKRKRSLQWLSKSHRILFGLAGNSYASNTLDIALSFSVMVQQDFPTSSFEDFFFQPGRHYIAVPRSLNTSVIDTVLDHVFDDKEGIVKRVWEPLTRLTATVAQAIANDKLLAACYTHRALQVWNSLMENVDEAIHVDGLVQIVDLRKTTAEMTASDLLHYVMEA